MRLTKKLNPPYERVVGEDYIYTSETRLTPSFAKVEQKLGQLEDIEEELGIDLITLFKALRSGIHIIDDGYPYNDRVDLIYSLGIPCGFKGRVSNHCVFFKDYGKTWALTKEELL